MAKYAKKRNCQVYRKLYLIGKEKEVLQTYRMCYQDLANEKKALKSLEVQYLPQLTMTTMMIWIITIMG